MQQEKQSRAFKISGKRWAAGVPPHTALGEITVPRDP